MPTSMARVYYRRAQRLPLETAAMNNNIPTRLLIPFPDARYMAGGIPPSTWSKIVAEGKIKVVRIGRRGFVEPEELRAFVERQSAQKAG